MIIAESDPRPWQCSVSNGSVEFLADTTAKHGGSGTGIRPHELLAAALAACLNMTVRMAADRREVDHDGVATAVELDRDGDPAFRYAVHVDGVDGETEASLRRAAEGCPVRETLTSDLRIEADHELAVDPS